MLSLFRGGRRERVPDDLWDWALAEHPILAGLSADEAGVLRGLCEELLGRKQLIALAGVPLSEELKLSIAVQASLPVLRLGLRWYRGWGTLYLVPDEYEYEDTETDAAGVVHEIRDTVSGQTMQLGSVVLSVADVEASGSCDGYNVVIHEMAHILDRQNGTIDGAPPLHAGMSQEAWTRDFTEAYTDLQSRVTEPRTPRRARGGTRGRRPRSRIDPYAAEAPEEFFAVASEVFFEQPWVLRNEYPAVYAQLSRFYRQNPLERLPAPPRRGAR